MELIRATTIETLWQAYTPGYAHTHGMIYTDGSGHYYEWSHIDRDGHVWLMPIVP